MHILRICIYSSSTSNSAPPLAAADRKLSARARACGSFCPSTKLLQGEESPSLEGETPSLEILEAWEGESFFFLMLYDVSYIIWEEGAT